MIIFLTLNYNLVNSEMLNSECSIRSETNKLVEVIKLNVDRIFANNPHGKPTTEELDSLTPNKITPQALHNFMQKYFLRPAERLDKASIKFYKSLFGNLDESVYTELLDTVRELGYIEKIVPYENNFKYIIIHGSTIPNMRERIMALDEAVRSGIVDISPETQIIFANGYRPIFSSETLERVTNTAPYPQNPNWKPEWVAQDGSIIESRTPKDEPTLARVAWAQLYLSEPLSTKTPFFVDAEKRTDQTRAHTGDTMQRWIEHFHPQSGQPCLSVSTQPFALRQERHVELALLKNNVDIDCESLAPAAPNLDYPSYIALGVLFDDMARDLQTQLDLCAARTHFISGESSLDSEL